VFPREVIDGYKKIFPGFQGHLPFQIEAIASYRHGKYDRDNTCCNA
jgi:hypothetical protein